MRGSDPGRGLRREGLSRRDGGSPGGMAAGGRVSAWLGFSAGCGRGEERPHAAAGMLELPPALAARDPLCRPRRAWVCLRQPNKAAPAALGLVNREETFSSLTFLEEPK